MADTLEILAKVVEGLKPLADRARGEPLRAQDWNQLVTSITDLAQLVAAREAATDATLAQRFAPRDHGHEGQVQLSWFEPQTRQMLERAVNGAVEQTTAIERLDGQVASLTKQLKDMGTQVAKLQSDLVETRETDFVRKNAIERVQLDLESVRTVERSVTGLTNRFDGFDDSKRRILEFQDSLRDANGQPIDVAQLREGVAQLGDLRERLTLANGQLASLTTFERQIASLERRLGRGTGNVRASILEALGDASFLDGSTLETRLQDRLIGTINPRIDAFEGRLQGVDERFTTLQGVVEMSRDDLGSLRAEVGTVRGSLAGIDAVSTNVTSLTQRVNDIDRVANEARQGMQQIGDLRTGLDRLSDRTDGLSNQLTTSIATVNLNLDGLRNQVGVIGERTNPNGLFETRLAELGNQLNQFGDVSGRFSRLETSIERQDQRLQGVQAQTAELENQTRLIPDLSAGLTALQGRGAAIDVELGRLRSETTTLGARFNTLNNGGLLGGAGRDRIVIGGGT
jgi:chromosome segregation ATPase